jgi:hypothetical protein
MASTNLEGYFNVKSFGATGNGTTNDSPNIQKTIDEAVKAHGSGGGVVWFPPGTYLLGPGPRSDRGIHITAPVILAGAGAGTPFGNPPETDHITTAGSKFFVTDTRIVPIWISGQGTVMRDLAMYHQQPDPQPGQKWEPWPYNAAIFAHAADIRLENIFLRNPTIGVLCENTGRLSINRLFGQPLQVGIQLDDLHDTIKIDNIHFWRYWSMDSAVSDYLFEKAHAIKSYRNDNPLFSSISTIGYNTGFLFSKKENAPEGDITSKFQIVNADNDSGHRGIKIDGPLTTGNILNYNFQGFKESETGIHIQAPGAIVQATNVRITLTGTNSIRVSGAGARLSLENVWIQPWNQSGIGFPGIEAVEQGTVVSVGFNRVFTEKSDKLIGGDGTVALVCLFYPESMVEYYLAFDWFAFSAGHNLYYFYMLDDKGDMKNEMSKSENPGTIIGGKGDYIAGRASLRAKALERGCKRL